MSLTPEAAPSTALQKRLGLPFAIAIMAGSVIGAGILRTPGVVANEMPVFWGSMLVWVLGGIYVLLSVNVASELTTALPRAGGIYVPVHEAFGDGIGLLAGWAIWAGYVAGGAALSLAFAEFLAVAVPTAGSFTVPIAIGVLLLVTIFNWLGVEEGRVANIIGLSLKLALLGGVVIAAFATGVPPPSADATAPTTLSHGEAAIGWVAFITALQIVLGAYDGWQGPTFFAEEDKDPARNIPRALFTSAVLLLAVYLAINLCVFSILDIATLRTSDLPVALLVEGLLGPAGMKVTGVAAAIMALLTLNALAMTHPRILYGLARDGLFLRSAMLVNRGGTPWVALLTGALVAIPLILTDAYVFVFKIQVAIGMLAALLYNASYFALRWQRPELDRPFRAIGHPVLPALILLVTIALFAAVVIADPISGLWVAGLIGICVPVGIHLGREKRKVRAAGVS